MALESTSFHVYLTGQNLIFDERWDIGLPPFTVVRKEMYLGTLRTELLLFVTHDL